MGRSDYAYILARPIRALPPGRVGACAFHHEHYRGFGTTPHAHDELQLIVPLGGRMHFYTEDEDHLIGPEWACLIWPGTRHGFNCLDGEQNFLALFAPPSWLEGLHETLASIALPPRGAIVARHVGLWLQGQHIATELATVQPGRERVLAACLDLLGTQLLRAMAAPAPPAPGLPEPRVLRAVDAMLQRYGEPLTVAGLAAELAMSPRHFERGFKQATGASPRQFLIEVRIGASKEMLRTTSWSVTEVALACGFQTPSHFTETFQRLTGMTPSAWRGSTSQLAHDSQAESC